MNTIQISLQNDKLLAEFVGFQKHKDDNPSYKDYDYKAPNTFYDLVDVLPESTFQKRLCKSKYFDFGKDWNWLHEVWNKWLVKRAGINTEDSDVEVYETQFIDGIKDSNSKQEAYAGLVGIVTWYNNYREQEKAKRKEDKKSLSQSV